MVPVPTSPLATKTPVKVYHIIIIYSEIDLLVNVFSEEEEEEAEKKGSEIARAYSELKLHSRAPFLPYTIFVAIFARSALSGLWTSILTA